MSISREEQKKIYSKKFIQGGQPQQQSGQPQQQSGQPQQQSGQPQQQYRSLSDISKKIQEETLKIKQQQPTVSIVSDDIEKRGLEKVKKKTEAELYLIKNLLDQTDDLDNTYNKCLEAEQNIKTCNISFDLNKRSAGDIEKDINKHIDILKDYSKNSSYFFSKNKNEIINELNMQINNDERNRKSIEDQIELYRENKNLSIDEKNKLIERYQDNLSIFENRINEAIIKKNILENIDLSKEEIFLKSNIKDSKFIQRNNLFGILPESVKLDKKKVNIDFSFIKKIGKKSKSPVILKSIEPVDEEKLLKKVYKKLESTYNLKKGDIKGRTSKYVDEFIKNTKNDEDKIMYEKMKENINDTYINNLSTVVLDNLNREKENINKLNDVEKIEKKNKVIEQTILDYFKTTVI